MSVDPAVGLLRRLDLLHARVVALVQRRGVEDGSSNDPLRGLHLPREVALQWGSRPAPTALLSAPAHDGEHEVDDYRVALEPSGAPDDRLDPLAYRFALEPLDVHILLTSWRWTWTADSSPCSRSSTTTSRAAERRCPVRSNWSASGHIFPVPARFHATGPLRRGGLLCVEEDRDRPLPGRTLSIPERVVAHLLADDSVDEDLIGVVSTFATSIESAADGIGSGLARGLGAHRAMVHFRERRKGTGAAAAVNVLREGGHPVVCFEPPSAPDAGASLVAAVLREARLRAAGVVVASLPDRPEVFVRALEGCLGPADVPVVLVDPRPFDPRWSRGTVVSLDLLPERGASEVWAEEIGDAASMPDLAAAIALLESAFLLQRLEAFDGVAVLTTNLRANIDEAFTRRLDLVVEFPFPDPPLRARLWHQSLAHAPCAADLDLGELGTGYELSGGAIRSAALTAAYLAAGRGGSVTTEDARLGAQREYQKMGRLIP